MITIIALVIQVLISLISPSNSADVTVIPPKPDYAPTEYYWDAMEWAQFESESYWEHYDAFTELFNSYSYKLSKNGRSMINGKFVKMGA